MSNGKSDQRGTDSAALGSEPPSDDRPGHRASPQPRTQPAAYARFDSGRPIPVALVRMVFPEYHPHYFGAFVRDPDGNNVEAVPLAQRGITKEAGSRA